MEEAELDPEIAALLAGSGSGSETTHSVSIEDIERMPSASDSFDMSLTEGHSESHVPASGSVRKQRSFWLKRNNAIPVPGETTAGPPPIVRKRSPCMPVSARKKPMYSVCCTISAGSSVSGIWVMSPTGIPI